MNKEKLKGFIAGVCTTAVFAGVATAFAVTADIRTDKFRVYWGGVVQKLRDANGNEVTPIMYHDSVYVPLRAMANLAGVENKDIDYNADAGDGYFEVYVKGRPIVDSVWLEDFPEEDINRKDVSIRTGDNAKFKLKNETIKCQNLMLDSYSGNTKYDMSTDKGVSNIFVLDSKYSRLEGKAVMPYENVGSSGEGMLAFYRIDDNGNKTLIKEYQFKQTEEPQDISVDISDVTNLMIQWKGNKTFDSEGIVALYDVKLVGKGN